MVRRKRASRRNPVGDGRGLVFGRAQALPGLGSEKGAFRVLLGQAERDLRPGGDELAPAEAGTAVPVRRVW